MNSALILAMVSIEILCMLPGSKDVARSAPSSSLGNLVLRRERIL